jgi:uncharacterized damage-inducible protein DinB
MKDHIRAIRYLAGALAICAALNLVSFAQQATGAAMQPMAKTATADPVAKLVADWTRAKDYTKEYIDAMPEEGVSFKPTPDIRSFAEQMLHLANANFLFASTATGATNPQQGKNLEKMDEYKTKAGLTKIVMESYDFVITSVKGMDLKKMDEPIKLFNRFDATRGGALEKAFEHQTHHRGQTTIYLRLKGVTPPAEKLF